MLRDGLREMLELKESYADTKICVARFQISLSSL